MHQLLILGTFHASFIIILCLYRPWCTSPPHSELLCASVGSLARHSLSRASLPHPSVTVFSHVSRIITSFLYLGSPLFTTYPSCLSDCPIPCSDACFTSTSSHFVSILTTIGTRLGPEVAMRPRLSLAGGAPLVNDLWRRISAFPHVGRSCFLAV